MQREATERETLRNRTTSIGARHPAQAVPPRPLHHAKDRRQRQLPARSRHEQIPKQERRVVERRQWLLFVRLVRHLVAQWQRLFRTLRRFL